MSNDHHVEDSSSQLQDTSVEVWSGLKVRSSPLLPRMGRGAIAKLCF